MERIVELACWTMAVGGSVLFILKVLILLLGGHGDLDHGGDFGGHGDLHGGAHDHAGHAHGSSWAFQFLSIQALATFAMGAGWMGLAALKGAHATGEQSVGTAILFGVFLVWLMTKLMQRARGLETSGTLDVRNAIGQDATVYLTIPAQGHGQVQVVVQGRLMTLDARSTGVVISTGTAVRVRSVDQDSVLVVDPG